MESRNPIPGKAKVAWKSICLPKAEGGLGIRKLTLWNKALMMSQIWKILSHKESLWVKWIHSYRLATTNFWETSIMANASWGMCKILQTRDEFRWHIISIVGNGKNISAWYDSWSEIGPLKNWLS